MKKKRLLPVVLIFALVVALTSCSGKNPDQSSSVEKEKKESQTVKVSVLCVGDIMAHAPNISSSLKSDGSYDFTDNYEYVEEYIESADLALCNMETTFKGGTPQGYPLFNAPDSLADAVKSAGFDVAFTSNNHMMDTGYDGMQRTLEILRQAGLKTVGSRLEGEDKGYAVVKVNGAKIGLVSYTYETTQTASTSVTINGNPISEDSKRLINSFNYHDLDTEDYDRIQADMDGCREDGADVVICYLHWGNEYEQKVNTQQEEMAQELANRGADVIFASHPHVLQKIDVLTSEESGQKVPVFYSLGNFISNQRTETLSNKYTEYGAMGTVRLTIRIDKDQIKAESVSVMPTWVDKYQSGSGTLEYRIIPLDSSLSTNQALAESGHFSRAQAAKEYAEELFGEYIEGEAVIPSSGKTGGTSDSQKTEKTDSDSEKTAAGQTTEKSGSKLEKTTDSQTTEKSGSKTEKTTGSQTAEKSSSKTEKTADSQSAEKSTGKTTEKSGSESADSSDSKTAEKSDSESTEKTSSKEL